MARRALLAALLAVAGVAPLAAQPSSLPANTVLGRLGVSAGPPQAIPFTTLFSSANIQPVTANLTALLALGSTGFPTRTGTNTWAQRSVAGTANEITVTNGNGVSGNPTISLPASITLTGKAVSGGTFTGGAFNGTLGATTPSSIVATSGQFNTNVGVGILPGAKLLSLYSAVSEVSRILIDSGAASGSTGVQLNVATVGKGGFYVDNATTNINWWNALHPVITVDQSDNVTLNTLGGALKAGSTGINGVAGCLNSDGATPAAITAGSCSGAFNGTVGATTPSTGKFTTLEASSSVKFSTFTCAGSGGFLTTDGSGNLSCSAGSGTGVGGTGGTAGQTLLKINSTAANTGYFNERAYNISSNASTDCTGGTATVLSTVIGSFTNALIPPGCTIKVSADDTIAATKTLTVACGATVTVDNTKTLTINARFPDPGTCSIFSGAGTVTGIRQPRPEWWGAVNDGSTSDIAALRKASASAEGSCASAGGRATVLLSAGSGYAIDSEWDITPTACTPVGIKGVGAMGAGSRIYALATFSGATPAVWIKGTTGGAIVDFELADFGVIAANASAAVHGLAIGGDTSCGKSMNSLTSSRVRNIEIENFQTSSLKILNISNLSVEDVGAHPPTAGNKALYISNPCAGEEFGLITFKNSTFETKSNVSDGVSGVYIESTAAASIVAGLHFEKGTVIYRGNPGMQLKASGGGIIQDFWIHSGVQFDSGGCSSNCQYQFKSLATGSGSQIYDVHIDHAYFRGVTDAFNALRIESASSGVTREWFVTNNWFANIGSSTGALAVYFNNIAPSLTFTGNHFMDVVNPGSDLVTFDGSTSGVIASHNTVSSTGATNVQYMFSAAGTSSYITACPNMGSGLVAGGNILRVLSGGTAISSSCANQ